MKRSLAPALAGVLLSLACVAPAARAEGGRTEAVHYERIYLALSGLG